MTSKTAQKVANLLGAVATTLTLHGRPRKGPGGWRPEAVTHHGKACHPTMTSRATKFSLVGALKADAKALGYNWHVREAAMWAILDAESDAYNGGNTRSFYALDQETYDTRQLIRRVTKASKTAEKQAIAA